MTYNQNFFAKILFKKEKKNFKYRKRINVIFESNIN